MQDTEQHRRIETRVFRQALDRSQAELHGITKPLRRNPPGRKREHWLRRIDADAAPALAGPGPALRHSQRLGTRHLRRP
nr:hypothetical protein [Bosea sp. LC85]